MKKNILACFLVLCTILPNYSHDEIVHVASQEQENNQKNTEFEDFFGVDETPEEAAIPQPKKEKPTVFQLFYMRMGASVLNTVDSCYAWFCAVWAYARSLVKHEPKA